MLDYGAYIKSLRQEKGLTLREAEATTGISNAYLSQLESGKIKQPSPSNLFKLAELYGIPYESLMEKVGYPVQKPVATVQKKEHPSPLNRLGKLTEEEETELSDYLDFIRNRRRK
ncbi:MAG: helix-turn-helix transcriptional regulator [Bacteroidetes bacterium]|nr:helix-turn-helix transcriptional regulator [Bacteroidota bacterium]